MFALTGGRGHVAKYMKRLGLVDLECDVANLDDVRRAIERIRPNVILHLASKSDVDWCEEKKNEPIVSGVNLRGTFNVALAAEEHNADVVLMSSAHVFSGSRWWGKYKEGDALGPVNFYGHSKLNAEALTESFSNLKVVRTSYLFDYKRLEPMLQEMIFHPVEYPDFIQRSFMYLPHFAKNLIDYMIRFDDMPTILHISGTESVSWYEFMQIVTRYCGDPLNVRSRRKEVGGYAPRGHNLSLDVRLSERLGFKQFSYRDGVVDMVREL